jgi:hypothetical protein
MTFSMSDDQTEVIFSASTPQGEEWMGAPEVRKPVGDDALNYRQAAEDAGLIVVALP